MDSVKTNTKAFICDVCEKTFKTKSSLTVHKRIHSIERSFKCDTCDKRFTRKDHLLQHMVVHTGKKEF